MKFGVLTDGIPELTLDEAIDFTAGVGASTIEFAAGSWSAKPHLDVPALLASEGARAELQRKVADAGLEISALNASGNQLHPAEPENDETTRDIVRLAGELGVDTIVMMSGLPAGTPGDKMPNWITTSWPPETTRMLEHQWNDIALPWWADFAEFATAQGVRRLAIEMHGNQLVYSVPSALRLREAVGDIVGVNFDPSHLFWMDADPIAAIAALGDAIQHVHAKDTRIESAVAVRSRLEYLTIDHPAERSWNYVTVGRGHDAAFWSEMVSALQAAGYDDTLSIEHEDVLVSGVDGIAEAAAVLRSVLG